MAAEIGNRFSPSVARIRDVLNLLHLAEGNENNFPAPSEIVEGEDWVRSTHRAARGWPGCPQQLERSGKWCIFPEGGNQVLDQQWERIRVATEKDELGYYAIASTAFHIQNGGYDDGVILVFTYDYADVEDAFRVRDALRELGFTKMLNYKKDSDSDAGISSANGDVGIALFQA